MGDSDDGEFEQKAEAGGEYAGDEDNDLDDGNSEIDDEDEDSEEENDEEIVEIKPQALEISADGALEEHLLIRREGWMYKKGGAVNQRNAGRHNWKKRWFVLKEINFRGQIGYELKYYDKPRGALKGSVGLSEVSIFCESTRSMQKRSQTRINKILKYEFQLLLPHGSALLSLIHI